MKSISDEIKISTAITPAAGVAGTTAIEGTVLDMLHFASVLMVIRFGAITTSAVTSIKAQQGDDSSLTDATDIEGSSQDIADSDDNEIFYIDLIKPTKRYVRLYVSRSTQNAVVAEAHYEQYDPVHPIAAHGTGVSGEKVVPVHEGTA